MKWQIKDPAFGDMIRIKSGEIYHYGIYVSDDEVIQFGLAPAMRPTVKDSEIEVLATDIDAFLTGAFLEVAEFDRKEKKKNRSPKEAVAYARARLGERGYHILNNNCEHFAYECLTGVHYSSQSDGLRAMFRNLPVVDVYFAQIPQDEPMRPLLPVARWEEISHISNERVKREKYYVWKLLEYALERSFGLRIGDLTLEKQACGKWTTSACEISLSHTDGVVAVAVSRKPVGVDVELLHVSRPDGLAERILDGQEITHYRTLSQEEREAYLIGQWTAKEACFKSQGLAVFEPSKTKPDPKRLRTDRLTLAEHSYIYSVSTETPDRIRVYPNVELRGR